MTIFGLADDAVRELVAGVMPESAETTMSIAECFARAAWSVIAEPGDGAAGALIRAHGAARALTALLDATASTPGEVVIPTDARDRWTPRLKSADVERALRSAARLGVRLLVPHPAPDESDGAVATTGTTENPYEGPWTTGLDDLGDHAPVALWARGDATLLDGGASRVAVVGARAATGYGEHVAGELASGLVERGVTVVSGAAYGIDGMAHRAALAAQGPTVAFLAGGVDRFYPAGHDELLRRIVDGGLVVSELPCGAAPTKWRFLSRNRLIAASCAVTVVVEAGARSGSLNTAGHASALGRPVGAVPGPVTSPASAGCHRLLRDYDAVCVTEVAHIMELLPGGFAVVADDRAFASSVPQRLGFECDTAPPEHRDPPEVVRVLDALGTRTGHTADEVAVASGLAVTTVLGVLAALDIDGRAVAREGRWCAVPRRR